MTVRCPAGDNDNAKRFTGRGDLEALEEFIVENPPEKGDAYKDIDSISYGLDMSGRICTIILVPDKD